MSDYGAEDTLILTERAVLGGGDSPLRLGRARIAISGPKISEIVEVPDGEPLEPAGATVARVLDFSDLLVSPAFINAHTHIALGFLRSFDAHQTATGNMVEDLFYRYESRLSAEDVYAFACVGAYESVLSGVALVWDHYYFAEEIARALVDVGVTGVVAPTLQDLAGPGSRDFEAALAASAALNERDDGIFSAVGPHATDTVSARLWRRAIDTARQLNVPLHAHLAQTPEEHARASERHGKSPADWLLDLGIADAPIALFAHLLYVSERELHDLAQAGAAGVICPYSQVVFGYPARHDVWSKAGLPWAVATDAAASNDSMNVQKELRFLAAARTRGVGHSAAFEAFAASGAPTDARTLGRHRDEQFKRLAPEASADTLLDRVWSIPGSLHPRFDAGVLQAGALANLVAWRLDHPSFWPGHAPLHTLAFADTTQAIHAVIARGRVIGTPGNFHLSLTGCAHYRDALTEATQRLRTLLES